MQSIQDYMTSTGVSRSTLFNRLRSGELLRKKIDGCTYVINPSELDRLNDEQKEIIVKDKKKEWDSLIIAAHKSPERKAAIIEEIGDDVRAYSQMGFKIVGYDVKSLYRKIKNGITGRKTRKDKSTPKNKILINPEVQERILKFAQSLYMQDSKASIRLLTHRVLYFARQNEEMFEIAAIPQPTLYRFIDERFDSKGIKEAHKLTNHFDQWNKKRPFVHRAFTQNIDFMDWLAIDDHMLQISGVLVYNELKGVYELKTVYGWFIIETKTMMPVAYALKIREFNSNDIKLLMLQALMNVGKPAKGFLMDNGLGAAQANLQMLNQLGVGYKTTKPYDPTGKAPVERFFGLLNSECVSLIGNYIGGKRIDGRHTTLKLSPEPAMITENDVIELVDKYIEGFFLDRPRKRNINGEVKEISIRGYYEKEYQNYGPEFISDQDLRHAFMSGEIKKYDGQKIMLGKHGLYVPTQALPVYLNGRKYDVRYNPLNMNEIDMYNIEAFRTPAGDIIERGQYIATLSSFQNKGTAEKQELVNKVWKDHKKNLRAISKSTMDITMLQNENAGTTFSTENANLVDTRKSLVKRIGNVLEDESLKLAAVPIQSLGTSEPADNTELSYEPVVNDDQEHSLSYGD